MADPVLPLVEGIVLPAVNKVYRGSDWIKQVGKSVDISMNGRVITDVDIHTLVINKVTKKKFHIHIEYGSGLIFTQED